MGTDPDPRPKSKGESRREQIVEAIARICEEGNTYATLGQIKQWTGIRSFNTLTGHLLILLQEGAIEWDRVSSRIKLVRSNETIQ